MIGDAEVRKGSGISLSRERGVKMRERGTGKRRREGEVRGERGNELRGGKTGKGERE